MILVNLGDEPFAIARGDRIAQLVLAPVLRADARPRSTTLDETARGAGGFGSTGGDASPTPNSTATPATSSCGDRRRRAGRAQARRRRGDRRGRHRLARDPVSRGGRDRPLDGHRRRRGRRSRTSSARRSSAPPTSARQGRRGRRTRPRDQPACRVEAPQRAPRREQRRRSCSRAPMSSSTAATISPPASPSPTPRMPPTIPLVSAAVGQFEGQLGVYRGWEADKPCYRCFVGDDPEREGVSCAEQGVLGALTGVMGSLAALEAIRADRALRRGQRGQAPARRPARRCASARSACRRTPAVSPVGRSTEPTLSYNPRLWQYRRRSGLDPAGSSFDWCQKWKRCAVIDAHLRVNHCQRPALLTSAGARHLRSH